MKMLSKGSVKKRAAIVVVALEKGWPLKQDNSTVGSYLVDPDTGQHTVVPADVMQYLVDEGVIGFTPATTH